LALAGSHWCGKWCGDLVGIVWGMVRAWVSSVSVTLFKGILTPISARLGVGGGFAVGVAKKAPIKGLKGDFLGV